MRAISNKQCKIRRNIKIAEPVPIKLDGIAANLSCLVHNEGDETTDKMHIGKSTKREAHKKQPEFQLETWTKNTKSFCITKTASHKHTVLQKKTLKA